MERIYKNIYCIGLYNEDETCIALLDNVQDFAKYCGLTLKQAADKLAKALHGGCKTICVKGQELEIAFVNMEED